MSQLNFIRFAIGTIAVTLGALVHAQPTTSQEHASAPSVTALNEEGAALYDQRDYRRAVERFLRAYAADPDPNLLFNIARCYEKMGDKDAAIEKYEEFVSLPGADTQGKSRAHQSLAALKQLSTAEQPRQQASPSEIDSSASQPAAAAMSFTRDPSLAESTQTSGSVWPWVSLAAGMGAAGVGATFMILGQQDHDKLIEASGYDDRTQPYAFTETAANDLANAGDRKKLVGTIALSAGGALLLTSALLFLLSGDTDADSPQVGLTVTSSTTNLSITGVF